MATFVCDLSNERKSPQKTLFSFYKTVKQFFGFKNKMKLTINILYQSFIGIWC